MGCNRLGDPDADPAQWTPIVERALELGITFFDTSNSYNQGRSEAVLGEVLGAQAGRTYVSTKVGFPPITNDGTKREYSAKTILTEVEASLRRLRRETIDLYMLHSPTVRQLETDDWATAIDRLKADGKIRFFGISTQDHASGIWALHHGAEFLQIEYHLPGPRRASDPLLSGERTAFPSRESSHLP
jgi:aryl-alcohol dehydrogenase-like predicted oxidoreductase